MGARQARQRPRRASQEATGTLSYQEIAAEQEGQRERGRTRDCSRGRRWTTTFRKLPYTQPYAKAARVQNRSPMKWRAPGGGPPGALSDSDQYVVQTLPLESVCVQFTITWPTLASVLALLYHQPPVPSATDNRPVDATEVSGW